MTDPLGQTKLETTDESELEPVQVGAAVVKLTKLAAAAKTRDLMATILGRELLRMCGESVERLVVEFGGRLIKGEERRLCEQWRTGSAC